MLYCQPRLLRWRIVSSKLSIVIVMIGIVGASALLAQCYWLSQYYSTSIIYGTGVVRYLPFEGGFYGIVGDNGSHYDPMNLPLAFRIDGLKVRFSGIAQNLLSTHMWGRIIKLTSIGTFYP